MKHHRHLGKCIITLLVIPGLWLTASQTGTAKPASSIDAIDLFGEGGFALLILIWIVFVLMSRPAGRVTTLLFTGLVGILIATLQDLSDEFYKFPEGSLITDVMESVPATLGIIIFSMGLVGWYREQQAFNNTLKKREHFYRSHTSLDYVSGLYNAGYMLQMLSRELELYQRNGRPLSILLFDVDNFDEFNNRFGEQEGDNLLQRCGEIIVMNLRRSDLACRFAGDCFIALLPDTNQAEAATLAAEINQSLASVAHKSGEHQQTVYYTVSIGVASARKNDDANRLIERANSAVSHAKRCGKNNYQMAV